MSRQRHWINYGNGGDTVFLTTTILDFVHVFRRNKPRSVMAYTVVDQCRLSRAILHAFVIMPHHIHLLVRLPANRTPRSFMQVLKPRCSVAVYPHLTPAEVAQFEQQTGLNGNSFWQRSFRGFVVETEDVFWQKVEYIHSNPVEAEYASNADEYPWSSAQFFAKSLWSEEDGLPYEPVLASLRTLATSFPIDAAGAS